MIYDGMEKLVGTTPILQLKRITRYKGLKGELYAKLEGCNPTGNTFDRAALSFIERKQREGALRPGSTVIVPTTGNLGLGVAAYAGIRGYSVEVVLPLSSAAFARSLEALYGARAHLLPPGADLKEAISESERICSETENSIMLNPYSEPEIIAAHEATAGEIYRDFKGVLDAVVIFSVSGSTLHGIGGELKKLIPKLKVFGVEYEGVRALTYGRANRLPPWVKKKDFDEAIAVSAEEAEQAKGELSRAEGLFAGRASGAALAGAYRVAEREEFKGKRVLVLLPDGGGRGILPE